MYVCLDLYGSILGVAYREGPKCPNDLSADSGKFLNDRPSLISAAIICRRAALTASGNLGRSLFNQSYLVRRKSETSCCGSR